MSRGGWFNRNGIWRTAPQFPPQFGTISIGPAALSATATLARRVRVDDSFTHLLGVSATNVDPSSIACALSLNDDGVTVTAARSSLSNALGTTVASFAVYEFPSGVIRRKQLVQPAMAPASGSGTADIAAVDLARSQLFWNGSSFSGGTPLMTEAVGYMTFTDETTVSCARGATGGSLQLSGWVIEF